MGLLTFAAYKNTTRFVSQRLKNMRHVAAFILAAMGGNSNPSEKDIKAIMNSVGIEPDSNQLKIVLEQLKGKDVFQLIEEGQVLLADMSIGGGAGPSDGGAAAPAAVEESESDSDMGMGLFD